MAFFQRKYARFLPRHLLATMLGIALFFPLLSLAETPPSEAPQQFSLLDPYLDGSREYVSEKFVNFASSVDRFFGNEINFQESNKSVLQLNLTRVIEEGGNLGFAFSARAKLHLPTTEKRLHLLLETNPEKNLSAGSAPGRSTPQGQQSIFKEAVGPDTYSAALRFENRDDSPWRFSADAGLKLENLSLPPFVRSRLSYTTPLKAAQLKVTESIFWFNSTGAGESTQLDIDHRLSDALLFRFSNGATWLQDKNNFDLQQHFFLFQTLDEQHSVLYQLSSIGVTNPQTEVTEHIALVLYRQRLHRDWMFLELSPQLHYPKVDNYRYNAQFFVRLDILFSK